MKQTIVISAVNLNKGGTLTILNDCLAYLSHFVANTEYRVIAIVHDKSLALYPNIEYIEDKWPKKRWLNRLWYEYVSLKRVSKEIGPVYLWFSLHDTTPAVVAARRAVYCHSPFAFYKAHWRELFFTPKIVLFSFFTKYIYRVNQKRNQYIVVQQYWFKEAMQAMFSLNASEIIVARPPAPVLPIQNILPETVDEVYTFIFASSPNSHKNFEIICRAVELLNTRVVDKAFKVEITVQGNENAYADWLYKKWGANSNIDFIGFVGREELFKRYEKADCLIFPSKVETWGLPISEFAIYDKAMLLADRPYAYETAAGAKKVAYFDPFKPEELAVLMKNMIHNDLTVLKQQATTKLDEPLAHNWQELFSLLLTDKK